MELHSVETLFRKGYLRIILSTGGLAMGINMPCKTVIFAGDDVRLTALNYRQAAGRAGRRGFDLLGNVIFHGLPLERTHSLMSSRLPKLMGHFPMSTSLILRLLTLLHNSKDTEFSKSTINTLLKQPRLVIGGVSSKEQVLHHLRFSIEFLRRQQLIGPSGKPLNFSGMSGHLYYIEKSAYAFHVLLCSRFLRDVVEAYPKADQYKREKICEDVMLVLAHIFGRRRASKGRETVRTLPPLPKVARDLLVKTNEETLATFSTYVTTFAKKFSKGPDRTLPFSGLAAGGAGVATPASAPLARSSFVALSGHSDAFTSIQDLGTSLRNDIFLEAAAIPHIDTDAVLNSYLLDFYRHGDISRLANENSILVHKVWFLLKDFSKALATVTAGLMCYIRDGPGAYFDAEKIRVKDEDGDMPPEDGDEDEDEEATVVTVESEMDEGAADTANEEELMMRQESKERLREAVVLLRAVREVQARFEEKFRAMYA